MPIFETICVADDLHPEFIWCQTNIVRTLAVMFLTYLSQQRI